MTMPIKETNSSEFVVGPLTACRTGTRSRLAANFSYVPSRDEAWNLVCEWTESDSLRKHMLAVETAVRAYARRFGEDEEKWAVAGLVHDLDYERHPDAENGHPRFAVEELRSRGYPEDVIHAVLSHAEYMGVPRDALLDRALFACDELSGFITACAYVRPAGIDGLTAKSVKKKL